MDSKYHRIQELIQAYESYENEKSDDSLFGFGLWLQQTQQPDIPGTTWNVDIEAKGKAEEIEGNLFGKNSEIPTHLEGQIARMFGMLGRIQHFHLKKIFELLPIHSIMEYGVLASAEFETPRRSDVIAQHLLENATGSHMISRLIKDDYLEEFSDPTDKRAKRLRITEKGIHINQRTREKLGVLSERFSKALSTEEKHTLLQLIIKLFHDHNQEMQGRKD